MQKLESRIAALETQRPTTWQWVWRATGETDADAIARAGFDQTVATIVFQWQIQGERHANH